MPGDIGSKARPASLRDALNALKRRDAEQPDDETTVILPATQRIEQPAPAAVPPQVQAANSTVEGYPPQIEAAPATSGAITSAGVANVGAAHHQSAPGKGVAQDGSPVPQTLEKLSAHAAAPSAHREMASAHGEPMEKQTRRGQHDVMTQPKTQIVRGPRRPTRTDFHQEPVVGWLVVIGGPGLGAFRPLFEGNNTIGRAETQRVSVNFGDDTISGEEQAFVRYDASDREFLFVPNLAKTNVVSINEVKPTSAVKLAPMDVITMGKTQLVFVPFCGEEFDWSELADLEG